jgi:ornithine--oxo-acid transaminase
MLSKTFGTLYKKSCVRQFSTNAELVALEQKYVCQNYKPVPAVMERAERIYMWDVEGKKYIDFMAGYGSTNQGHLHPEITKAAIA